MTEKWSNAKKIVVKGKKNGEELKFIEGTHCLRELRTSLLGFSS